MENGDPVSGLYPAAWIDPLGEETGDLVKECKERAGLYLRRMIGIRPMIDLNSYFVMVLNADPSISVIDPIIGMTGITKLYTQVLLPGPGVDWVKSSDEKRLYVSIPRTKSVAVVDLETFKVIKNITVGPDPEKLLIQPDNRYLWIGHAKDGGVSVVDLFKQEKLETLKTGKGFHDLAASADSRFVVATNRDDGSASFIDVRELRVVARAEIGKTPISVDYSSLSDAFYVAEGEDGVVHVFPKSDIREGEKLEAAQRIGLAPGLGPLRFSDDGRWGVGTNARVSAVHLIDAASNKEIHRIEVPGRPIQINFSRSFAYIRTLETPRVSMLELSKISENQPPPLSGFLAGEKPPKVAGVLPVADMIARAIGEAAILATSPGDATVYFYMEGMNAPMGNFRNYGHRPRAAMVADRTIREGEPGRYNTVLKTPAKGEFMAIFTMEAPEIIHCFRFTVDDDPRNPINTSAMNVEFLTNQGANATVGEETEIRVKFTGQLDGKPVENLNRVWVDTYRAPGRDREVYEAEKVEDGVYAVRFKPKAAGAYYLHLGATRDKIDVPKLPYLSLIARPPADKASN